MTDSNKSIASNVEQKQNSHHIYYNNRTIDHSSAIEKNSFRNSPHNQKDQYFQTQCFSKTQQSPTNKFNQKMDRSSWVTQQTPRTMNYVNLSYQKIKSLNTASPQYMADQCIEELKTQNQSKETDSKQDQSKMHLSFIINSNFYANTNNTYLSRRSTISQKQDNTTSRINEDSIENNKVPLYKVYYDHSAIKNNAQQNRKQEQQGQDILKLQLSPIIRRITQDSKNSHKSSSEGLNFTEKFFASPHNKNGSEKSDKAEEYKQSRDYKLQKKEILKKVKLSTEQAFHCSSGRARLKNKRQMFSPCQSARHECKVQFDNKYLIKTGFIHPSDKNKDVQMISVDLIQDRRQMLLAKLESLQQKKWKLTYSDKQDNECIEQNEQKEQDNRLEITTYVKSRESNENEQKKQDVMIQQQQEGNEVGDSCVNKQQSVARQGDQSTFSDKISQLKLIDNYNTMMKGIQNQLNDLNDIPLRDRQISQNNYMHTHSIIKDKSNMSFTSQIQLTPSNSKPAYPLNISSFQQVVQMNSSQNIRTPNSGYYINTSSSQNIKTPNSANQTIEMNSILSAKKKAKQFEAPFCNSNEILNRYHKQNEKITNYDANQFSPRPHLFLDIDKLSQMGEKQSPKGEKLEKLKSLNSPLTNESYKKLNPSHFSFGMQQSLPVQGKQNILFHLENKSQEVKNNNSNSTPKNILIQRIQQDSMGKKSSFGQSQQEQNPENNELLNQSNLSDDNLEKQQVSIEYITNEQTKININKSLNQHLEYQNSTPLQVDTSIINSNFDGCLTPINMNKIMTPRMQEQSIDINLKRSSVDKDFLSALLTSWQETKKQVKKPISKSYFQRRVILQKTNKVSSKKRSLNMKRIIGLILNFLKKLQKSKLSLNEFIEQKSEIFMEKPMQRLGSFVFFKAVKHNNLVAIKTTIQNQRYFVFDFDAKKQTCVHVAAKKGYLEMLKYIISQGADLNSKDIVGRKPLYYAIKFNHEECVRELLYKMADPWSCDNTNYYQLAAHNPNIIKLLKKFRKVIQFLFYSQQMGKAQGRRATKQG